MHLSHPASTRPFLNRLLLGALAILTLTGTANAWWDSDWTLRKKITIDTSSAGVAIDGSIGSVPMLIRFHDGNFAVACLWIHENGFSDHRCQQRNAAFGVFHFVLKAEIQVV